MGLGRVVGVGAGTEGSGRRSFGDLSILLSRISSSCIFFNPYIASHLVYRVLALLLFGQNEHVRIVMMEKQKLVVSAIRS